MHKASEKKEKKKEDEYNVSARQPSAHLVLVHVHCQMNSNLPSET